jgi:hypothetical protein
MEAKGSVRGLVSAGWIEVGERMSAISKMAERRRFGRASGVGIS